MSATEDAQQAIEANGFHCINDSAVGEQIAEMDRNASQFASSSKAGLEFYKTNVLENELIQDILRSHFKQDYALAHYQRMAKDPGHIFQLYQNPTPDVLLIQLWGKGSRVVYQKSSHVKELTSFRAANKMWETPRAVLKRAGIQAEEIQFTDGGLVILDARLRFETDNVSPVVCGYTIRKEYEQWPKLPRPKPEENADDIVAELENGIVGVNFAPAHNTAGTA